MHLHMPAFVATRFNFQLRSRDSLRAFIHNRHLRSRVFQLTQHPTLRATGKTTVRQHLTIRLCGFRTCRAAGNVVAQHGITFPQVKPTVSNHRVSPTWQLAATGNLEASGFFHFSRVGFDQCHVATGVPDVKIAISRSDAG